MREIKFRAYQKNTSLHRKIGMYKVDNIAFHEVRDDQPESGEVFLTDGKLGTSKSSEFFSDVDLMQYIGLEDKNGYDIYEGDIVKHSPDGIIYYIRVVAYEKNKFVLSRLAPFLQDEINWNKLEVIGNVYENSELLEDRL